MTTDNAPFSSFTNSSHWSDNQYPHGGTNYLVSNGLMLRTPENASNYAFAGDSLTLSNGNVNLKGNGQITLNDLRTYACRIANGINGTTTLYGTNTVYGTASGYSRYSGSSSRTTRIYTVFQGSGELSFDQTDGETGAFTVELRGESLPFLGGLRVVGASTELRLYNTNALGGALAAFRADALSLVSGGTLSAGSSLALDLQANRGITLVNGGALRMSSPSTLTLACPVAGTGSLAVRGDGRVVFDAPFTHSGDTVVEGGTLCLTAAFSMPDTSVLTLKSGCRNLEGTGSVGRVVMEGGTINPATGSDIGMLTVSNLTFKGGGLKFDFAPGGTADFVRVTGALSNALASPIPVTLTAPVTNECPAIRRLLTAPNLGSFTVVDFALQYGTAGLPEGTLDLIDEAGTVTLVFRQARPGITMSAQDGTSSFTVGDRWSDKLVPSADKDYMLVGTALLRTPPSDTVPSTFPGRSLSLTDSSDMRTKGLSVTVNDLRLYSGRITQGTPPYTQYLNGNISVFAPAAAPFNVEIEGDTPTLRQLVIGGLLSGSGDLRFRYVVGSSMSAGGLFTLTATNTAFTGGITVNGYRSIALQIADERNLGSDPAAFRANQLTLVSNGVLYATASLALDDLNRGVTLDTVGGVLRVEAGHTLTLASAVTGPGKLTQRGAGTLVLSGTNTYRGGTAVESNATLEVRSQWALGSNGVTFATNTLLRIPRDEAALPLGLRLGSATPLTVADKLRVAPDFGAEPLPKAFELPLFLLTGTPAFDTALVSPQNSPSGYRVTVETRTVDDAGTSRTQVYINYVKTGTLITVQ